MDHPDVLTQNEVDALLRGISSEDYYEDEPELGRTARKFKSWGLNKLSNFLHDPFGVKKREYDAAKMFRGKIPESMDRDIPVVGFFDAGSKAENVLADIHAKNEAQGSGNIKIPGTNIELINYSQCPNCERVFSHQEVQDYYANPNPVEGLERNVQYRGDTRMHCSQCDTYFYHSLVISDGKPANETWYLCRSQTVDAVEGFYKDQGEKVLTRQRGNRIQGEEGKIGILNDLDIDTLSQRPDLVTSVLQYTPPNLISSFVEGKNMENKDLLFGVWM